MSRWAISSSSLLVLLVAALAAPAAGRVLLTVDEALALAFPGCAVERRSIYLTEEQLARARAAAGVAIESAVVQAYEGRCGGAPGGTAYFDAHRVRTLPETLMVVIAPDDSVRRVEVLSFSEPADYLPRQPWYRQFAGRLLDDRLALRRDIQGVTGATLTARATTEAVRRALAIHREVAAAGAPPEAAR